MGPSLWLSTTPTSASPAQGCMGRGGGPGSRSWSATGAVDGAGGEGATKTGLGWRFLKGSVPLLKESGFTGKNENDSFKNRYGNCTSKTDIVVVVVWDVPVTVSTARVPTVVVPRAASKYCSPAFL